MAVRTDLAIDVNETLSGSPDGVSEEKRMVGDVKISDIRITSEKGAEALGKPRGEYITVEFPPVYKIADFGNLQTAVISALKSLLPDNADSVLVVGLGNTDITPDSIGPLTAGGILATRHISGQFAEDIGLKNLKSVAVISPGVLGKTGIETTELIAAAAKTVRPSAVIVIDALASRSVSRLFRTVQLSNTGISPGSGVKNSRSEISEKTIGVPVIAVGVPTVVDAQTLAFELTGKLPEEDAELLVTPKEADLLCDRISEVISRALNLFLQPEIDEEIILGLV